jgi:DNA-binding response OmpR family regulator
MRLAVIDSRRLVGELVGVVAKRRGWAFALAQGVDNIKGDLPFAPSVLVLVANDESGVEAAVRTLRQNFPREPILVLSEDRLPPNKTALIRAGAADVLGAPADPVEIAARVEAYAETAAALQSDDDHPKRTLADLEVDLGRYRAVKNSKLLKLTALELRILYCLLANYPKVAPMERFVLFGWTNADEADVSLVRTHICHIRRKLEAAGGASIFIRSRPKVGYVIATA